MFRFQFVVIYVHGGNGGKIMFKWLLVGSIVLTLTGCGRTLQGEAVRLAEDAIASGDFARGSLLLVSGCDVLHAQSIYLLRMDHYRTRGSAWGMLSAWLSLNQLDPDMDFIEIAAYQLMSEALGELRVDQR